MLNPLLVQLFGRDVVDRLENAGLTTDDAVARLDAAELSTRAGIAPDIARRVVALAAESSAPRRTSRPRRSAAAKPRSPKAGGRRKRRTSDKPAPAAPVVPSERAAAPVKPADPVESADPAADEEGAEIPVLQQSAGEIDAFVDEAGLIAWMGFAARTGPEGSLVSSVADGILEPDPEREPAPPQPATTTAPERSRAVTLEGSFWGFGSRPHGGATISPTVSDAPRPESAGDDSDIPESPMARPVPFHRRRSHDGH
jgi:hypothetical protein